MMATTPDPQEETPNPAAAEGAEAEPPVDRRRGTLDTILAHRDGMLRENGVDVDSLKDDAQSNPDDETKDPPAEGEDPGGEGEKPPAETGDEPAPDAEEPAEGEDPEQGGETPAAAADAGQAGTETDPDQQLIEVKVNGEVRRVTMEELTRNYQIEQTARANLNAANEALERADRIERRLAAGGRAPDGDTAADPADGDGPKDALDSIDWNGTVESLQYKNTEEAAKALRDLVAQLRSAEGADPQATQEQIYQQVSDRIEWSQAVQTFKATNEELVKDPQLARMIADRATQYWNAAAQDSMETGRRRPAYIDIWNAAGKDVSDWLKTIQGEPAPADEGKSNGGAVEVDTQKRVDQKRSANPPPASRAKAEDTPGPRMTSEEKNLAQRRSDAIQEMAKARGQATG